MINNYSLICQNCTSDIIDEDMYINFLLDVCICSMNGDSVYIKEYDTIYFDIVRFLEINGFLVSTDVENSLFRVKLNFNRMIMKDGKFCWCN